MRVRWPCDSFHCLHSHHLVYYYTSTLVHPLQTQLVLLLLYSNDGTSVETHLSDLSVPYQMHQCPFTSNSRSGYTIWYFAKSSQNIPSPPMVPQAKTGHLYIHLNSSTNIYQYWMVGINNQWESILKGLEYPLNHDQVLLVHSNGEPSWITRASTITTQSRKEREIQEKSAHG
jgi:hypothetical protein